MSKRIRREWDELVRRELAFLKHQRPVVLSDVSVIHYRNEQVRIRLAWGDDAVPAEVLNGSVGWNGRADRWQGSSCRQAATGLPRCGAEETGILGWLGLAGRAHPHQSTDDRCVYSEADQGRPAVR